MRPLLPLLLVLAACGDPGDDQDTGEPAPLDADGDGSPAREDCRDDDPLVHPGAVDVCNGVDDDCDLETDEDDGRTWYPDADGDGFGDAAATPVGGCDPPGDGYVSNGTDCDDAAADIFPGGVDLCDGLDQDCDGVPDGAVAAFANASAASDDADGSWAHPFPDVQSALDTGRSCVHVAPGTYPGALEIPAGDELILVGDGGRDATFLVGDGSAPVIRIQVARTVTLRGFTIRGGAGETGGGIQVVDAQVRLEDILVKDNTATRYGGGVAAEGANLVLDGVEIVGNMASYGGGGLMVSRSQVTATDLVLTDNLADRAGRIGYGGGLFVYNESDITVDGAVLAGNEAYIAGGAYVCYGSTMEGVHVVVRDNAADAVGGVYAYQSAVVTLRNAIFDANEANGYGGDVDIMASDVLLEHVVLAGSTGRSAIYLRADTAVVSAPTTRLSLAWSVVIGHDAYGIYVDDSANPASVAYSVEYNDFWSNDRGDLMASSGSWELSRTNGAVDPNFTAFSDDYDGANDDFHLSRESPLVDIGGADCLDADGSSCDVGCYGGAAGDW